MGKERHKRTKLHASAPKVKSIEKDKTPIAADANKPHPKTLPLPVLGENIFAGVKIGADQLKPQTLPDFDARSSVTSKTFKGMNMKKKDKKKMRQEVWMKKVDALQAAKKEEKEKKKREKTVIVGDLKPLEDTLPTLELLMKGTKKGNKQKIEEEKVQASKKAIRKESVRKKQTLDSINLFQQVSKHPGFKTDPSGAITEHLKQKMRQEEQMES